MSHLVQAETEIRTAISAFETAWAAAHGGTPVRVELTNRETVSQGDSAAYLKITIAPMPGGQASLGENPVIRQDGQILISAVVRAGDGVMPAKALLDFLLPYLSTKDFGLVKTYAAVATQPKQIKAEWYENAIVPYYYHYFYS
jgi:hypothetical protein